MQAQGQVQVQVQELVQPPVPQQVQALAPVRALVPVLALAPALVRALPWLQRLLSWPPAQPSTPAQRLQVQQLGRASWAYLLVAACPLPGQQQ